MRFVKYMGIAILATLVTNCAALENDLEKGVRYETNSQRLTRKIDAKRDPGELPKGINGYLWRAALDTVGFLPLVTADPNFGRIETQWYSQPTEPGIRSKTVIEILDPNLRRDTIRVTVARQVQDDSGQWSTVAAPAGSAQSLEDSIYTKALDLSPF